MLYYIVLALLFGFHSSAQSELIFSKLQPVHWNIGQGCNVRVLAPLGATHNGSHFPVKKSDVWIGGGGMTIPKYPFKRKQQSLLKQWGVENWLDPDKLDFSCYSSSAVDISTPATPIFRLQTKNATGWLLVSDDSENLMCNAACNGSAGYPASRNLNFCLYNNDKKICGRADAGVLVHIKKHPAADITPYILQILNSIEFLPDVVVPSSEEGEVRP